MNAVQKLNLSRYKFISIWRENFSIGDNKKFAAVKFVFIQFFAATQNTDRRSLIKTISYYYSYFIF